MRYALVAQLDRVTDYESVGRGFESLPAYQKSRYPLGYLLFLLCWKLGLERAAEHSEAKKCPVDIFLARGRVLLIQDASGTDVD